jgi:hypothetical protein
MVGYGYCLRLARQAGWPLRARKDSTRCVGWNLELLEILDLRPLLCLEMEVKTGTQ